MTYRWVTTTLLCLALAPIGSASATPDDAAPPDGTTAAPPTTPSPDATDAVPDAGAGSGSDPASESDENLLAHVSESGNVDSTQTFGKELKFFGIETNWSGYGDLLFSAVPREGVSTFDATHFNPVFSVRMTDTLSGELELEFEHGGAEINVEYAMIDWTPLGSRGVVIRAGKFLVPVGRYNEQLHPSFRWPQIGRPLMMTEVIPVEWSDVGVQVRGQLKSGTVAFDYAAFVVNGLNEHPGIEGDTDEGNAGFIAGLRSSLVDSNNDKGLGGRAVITSSIGELSIVSLGVSGYTGRASPTGDDAGAERLSIIDVDLYARQGGLAINAEGAQTLFGTERLGYFHRFERGAYLQLAYILDKLTFAARYDYATFGTQDAGVIMDLKDHHAGILTVKYAPAPSWSVRAEFEQPLSGTHPEVGSDGMPTGAVLDDTDQTKISAGLAFVF